MTSPKRVLIVEDELNVRRVMQMALESSGHTVSTAPDGPAGLERFGNGSAFDVVVLDLRMPVMEGLEVLRQIKRRTTAVPVIMATAYPSIELAVDAMKLGATDFIRKPLTPEVLRAAVDAATRARAPFDRVVVPEPSAEQPFEIETLTLNGFRSVHLPGAVDDFEHRFRVMTGADEHGTEFVVRIDPAAVERLKQFTGARHQPGGSFWASRAEELLGAILWTEGRLPAPGSLSVKDFSRLELDSALAWPEDTP